MWVSHWLLDTANDSSNPGYLVKGVQCYELFGGIALKIHTFSLHQYVVSLSKTRNLHCFSQLSCEMSTRRKHSHERCLFTATSFPVEIALKSQRI